MADWIPKFFPWNKDQPSHHTNGSSKKEEKGNKPFKCFIELTGKTLNSHNHLMDRLKRKIPDLQVVQTEAECDIILVFCPFVRTADRDIKAALERLNDISGTKPAVLVVLHHTFDTEHVASDSSRAVSRGNTITVDCLFYEDSGLLTCQKNEESLDRIVKHINLQIQRIKSVGGRTEIGRYRGQTAYTDYHSVTPKQKSLVKSAEIGQPHWSSSPHSADSAAHCNYPRNKQEMMNKEQRKRKNPEQAEKTTLKYFTLLAGRTLNTHETFIARLKQEIPQLQQVPTVHECDFILAFCPIVSRAGTDIQAALKELNKCSAIKPAVLVVLHRTFDPDCVVPDSSRSVHRENTITVDCLFCEDQGLLQCPKNHESFIRIINHIKPQICSPITDKESDTEDNPKQPPKKKHKYFICEMGNRSKSIDDFMGSLEQMSDLQKVTTKEECDFILTFYPFVSQDGTAFQKAIRKLESISENKHVVFVKPQGSCAAGCVAPDVSRGVKSENVSVTENHESVQNSRDDERDTAKCEPMETQEAGGPSQGSDKLENITKEKEPNKNKLETMGKELWEKNRQIAEMERELKKLQTEIAEFKKKERPQREEHMQVKAKDKSESVRQAERIVSKVKADLANTIQNLIEKTEDLENVQKLLSEGK